MLAKREVVQETARGRARDFSFQILRRQQQAKALAAYVLDELRCGRSLEAVLADARVQSEVTKSPWLLDDLAMDQEIAAASRLTEVKEWGNAPRQTGGRRGERHALAV